MVVTNRSLGNVLKSYRERAKLSQLQLAFASNINQATISDIELGKVNNTSMKTMRRICTALKLNVLEILDIHGWDVHESDLDKPLLVNRYE
jgi:transcriptional regulator with XRE-family HTH domain